MAKYRSRLDIIADILGVVSDGARKTQIMYEAYLSYRLLTRYLNDVLNAGLVVCVDGKCFRLTPKGERFLERFGEYHKSRVVVEETLDNFKDQKLILEQMCPHSGAVDLSPKNGEKDGK